MPTFYLLISLALAIGINFIFPIKRIISSPYTYVGVLFILFGIIINVWADNLFKKNKTTVKPYEERNLEQEFGEKYLDYKKKVRRWI